MKKNEVRKFYKSLRKDLSIEKICTLSSKIFNNLKKINFLEDLNFHIFLPIEKNHEINTYPIIEWLFSENKNVILPLIVDDNMINCKVKNGFITKLNSFQIPEPILYEEISSREVDVILIPMFVCDKKGNRVGYGRGYYDKFLSKCKPSSKKIGLSYFNPIDSIEDNYSGDFPLDLCITPELIVSF